MPYRLSPGRDRLLQGADAMPGDPTRSVDDAGGCRHRQRGVDMNRVGSIIVGALLVVALAPASAAAADYNEHGTGQGTWTEDDFCGTGVSVEHTYTEIFTFHAFQANFRGQDVLTNPLTGDSIVVSYANLNRGQFSGDPDGIHTFTFTHAGLQELIQTSHEAVLIVDTGYVISTVTFDGDEFISEENVARGPHPELDSGFALFCEVAVPALGIG